MTKCQTCRRRFLTRTRKAAHEWQCPRRLAAGAQFLLDHLTRERGL